MCKKPVYDLWICEIIAQNLILITVHTKKGPHSSESSLRLLECAMCVQSLGLWQSLLAQPVLALPPAPGVPQWPAVTAGMPALK